MPSSRRLALLMVLLGACERPEARPARLQGRVLDVEGAPVAGARVRVGSAVTSTRADGTFFVLDLPADTPLTIEVQSSGHSSWQDLRYLPPDVWSYVDANVAPVERVRLEDASKGGVVETSTGLRLQFPPGAVQDATGALVTGPVTVAVAHLDEPHEVVAAPGGLLVMGALGGQTRERSWGLAEITLTANSQPAQLAQPVVLSMPLAAAWEDEPLRLTWLNPETSRWEEIADVRIQDGRGLVTVEHFSWYGVGRPINDEACLILALEDENGNNIASGADLIIRVIGRKDDSGEERLFYGDFAVDKTGQVNLTPIEKGTYDFRLTYGKYEWSMSRALDGGCDTLGDDATEDARSVDADGDGFPTPTDCQDENLAGTDKINPAAEEDWYDGVDQDCSGGSDFDQDGDGDNCEPNGVNNGCEKDIRNSDYSENGDCDDGNSKRSSRHNEVCNYPKEGEPYEGLDDDCDESIDEDAIDAKTWFVDEDGDGFGVVDGVDDKKPVVSCDQPDGLVEKSGDCDDKNPCAYPGTFSGRTTDVGDECGAQYVAICEGGADGDDLNCDREYQSGSSDHDEDDFSACDGDCNDADASVKPDADEECGDFTEFGDPIDNDCDGEIDENVTSLWYADGDGDGYGDDAKSRYACDDDTVGWVSRPGDCDDLNPLIYPERQEICDDLDNDCDGSIDESPGLDAPKWYCDDDCDGYGAEYWGLACEQPKGRKIESGLCNVNSDCLTSGIMAGQLKGLVTNTDDCYDAGSSVYPEAPPVCNDRLLNDCTTAEDESPTELTECRLTGTISLDQSDVVLVGEGLTDWFGQQLSTGDIDGDTLTDLLISAPNHRADSGGTGAAYLFRTTGTLKGFASQVTLSAVAADFKLVAGENQGIPALRFTEDLNKDGTIDVMFAVPSQDLTSCPTCEDEDTCEPCGGEGRIHILSGKDLLSGASARTLSDNPDDYIHIIDGGEVGANAGNYVLDVAEPGTGSILYSESYTPDGADNSRNAVVVYSVVGKQMLSRFYGSQVGQITVAAVGDVTGDGMNDLWIGDPWDEEGSDGTTSLDYAGAAYLMANYTDTDTGTWSTGKTYELTADIGVKIVAESSIDFLGWSVSPAGDVNGDGHRDLLVGASNQNPNGTKESLDGAGAAYLILGGDWLDTTNTKVKLAENSLATNVIKLVGENDGDKAGSAVMGDFDADGDGLGDVLVGARWADVDGDYRAGTAYLLMSSGALSGLEGGTQCSLSTADYIMYGVDWSDYSGRALASVGDTNGDLVNDFLIGSSKGAFDGSLNEGLDPCSDTGLCEYDLGGNTAYLLFGQSY